MRDEVCRGDDSRKNAPEVMTSVNAVVTKLLSGQAKPAGPVVLERHRSMKILETESDDAIDTSPNGYVASNDIGTQSKSAEFSVLNASALGV